MIFAEIMFAGEKYWMRCWIKCYLKCWSRCWLTIWWNFRRTASNADASNALAGFRCCQKAAPDAETIRCIGGLSKFLPENCTWLWGSQMHWRIDDVLPESCTWHWNNQMHWRIFGFVKKTASNAETVERTDEFAVPEMLHLTLRLSDALAGFRFCQKCCTQRWWCVRCIDDFWIFETQVRRFSRCLGYRCSGKFLTDNAGRQAGKHAGGQARRRFCWQCCNARKEILDLIDALISGPCQEVEFDEC